MDILVENCGRVNYVHQGYNKFNEERKGKCKYSGLTGGFLLLQIFSVAISVSPHVCFISDLILISMFLR